MSSNLKINIVGYLLWCTEVNISFNFKELTAFLIIIWQKIPEIIFSTISSHVSFKDILNIINLDCLL